MSDVVIPTDGGQPPKPQREFNVLMCNRMCNVVTTAAAAAAALCLKLCV